MYCTLQVATRGLLQVHGLVQSIPLLTCIRHRVTFSRKSSREGLYALREDLGCGSLQCDYCACVEVVDRVETTSLCVTFDFVCRVHLELLLIFQVQKTFQSRLSFLPAFFFTLIFPDRNHNHLHLPPSLTLKPHCIRRPL